MTSETELQDAAIASGTMFANDFRVVRRLRSGGMGSVFVVVQLSTGKERALKLLAPSLAMHAETRERFVLEAKAASAIESDHVVEIVCAGIDEKTSTPYLVMELLRGEDLCDRIERAGPMSFETMVEVFSQIGHALQIAHEKGILHRDLKPENIFLADSRRRDGAFCAKVLDFGVAKLLHESGRAGTLPVGSPGYMAPEQTDPYAKLTPAADVWSLGLLAFYLLTGAWYWIGGGHASVPALMREVCLDPLEPPTARAARLGVAGELVPGFDDWFGRCVTREPEDRFADAGEAVRALLDLRALHEASQREPELELFPGDEASQREPELGLFPGDEASQREPELGLFPGDELVESDVLPDPMFAEDTSRSNTPAVMTVPPPPPEEPRSWSRARVAGLCLIAAGIMGVAAAVVPAATHDAAAPSGSALAPVEPPEATPTEIVKVHTTTQPAAIASAAPAPTPSARPPAAPLMRAKALATLEQDPRCPAGMTLQAAVNGWKAFCIDRTEVTVAAYGACQAQGRCEKRSGEVRYPGLRPDLAARYSELCNDASEPDQPVNCVTWNQANAFCEARGAHLPSSIEWLAATSGPGPFPWQGDVLSERNANVCDAECSAWGALQGLFRGTLLTTSDGFSGTAPVGSFEAGASSSGVFDLLGNVAEWLSDAKTEERVAAGGSFLSSSREQLFADISLIADASSQVVGFRCARNP